MRESTVSDQHRLRVVHAPALTGFQTCMMMIPLVPFDYHQLVINLVAHIKSAPAGWPAIPIVAIDRSFMIT